MPVGGLQLGAQVSDDYSDSERQIGRPSSSIYPALEPHFLLQAYNNPPFRIPSLWSFWTGRNPGPSSRSCTHGSPGSNFGSKATARVLDLPIAEQAHIRHYTGLSTGVLPARFSALKGTISARFRYIHTQQRPRTHHRRVYQSGDITDVVGADASRMSGTVKEKEGRSTQMGSCKYCAQFA